MAKKSKSSSLSINVETINRIVALEGQELLHQVTMLLHREFGSQCTCIVELDKLNFFAQTLSYACQRKIQTPFCYSMVGTPCHEVSKSTQLFCLFSEKVAQDFPQDSFLAENEIEAYLGVPLRAQNGENLGILISTFTSPVSQLDEESKSRLIYYHTFLANIVVHSLRAKWFSARSDSLVNQLSHEISHDALTGLLNRSRLSGMLEHYDDVVDEPLTLAYIDIDNFKSINNLYGNYIGDQVLKFVAMTIEESLPEQNHAFRISGDEFAFVTFSSDPFTICQNIIVKLRQGYRDSSHKIKLSASIGLACKSEKSLSADQLMLNTSLALKDCKQVRNNHIQSYDIHLSNQYYRRTMVIDALRNELDRNNTEESEIYVALQPIVSLDNPTWDYFETLARWNSKTLGTISPMEFIEAAEQSGLIVELGERIVALACKAKKELEQGLGYKVRLSLNCSAHELADSTRYMRHLNACLNKYQFAPDEFTIELTETVLLSQTNEVRYILDKLRALGFTVALDDFGTGYSSLNYIHSYPIDTIKIDATFVRNILFNETAERVVNLIIQLAKQLKVNLIAEGVENEDELNKLSTMGCKQIQGYYFARPEIPSVLIKHYLKTQNSAEEKVVNRLG
ncbi:putative bifunctional diguanylate cyclase/phosphodiesterase [Vibrio panuliri]|uniref:Diguanylate cyclase n=1 Tax=Vibrio panuliri TaxID=1381081 RepID=A0ABX3F885_9VIBR|nr:GGDEF domain-containing protein [Vibrio panuliri]KAB1458285.1 GGDEF domain-containing protein [Vibrio panuliri]OLQ86802.1 diguanylate cyclase [Vibrio panuliri]